MKKQIEVITPPKKGSKTLKEITLCDLCESELKPYTRGWGTPGSVCMLCDRDICRNCCTDDPTNGGDYPGKYCNICYKIRFIDAREYYSYLEDKYDEAVEKMNKRLKEKSLNHGKNSTNN